MEAQSFSDIQRQFTRYLRNPDRAPLPAGTDRLGMRYYAKSYRRKLHYLLETSMPALAATLGREALSSLVDDYVRLPRESLGGKSTLAEAFVQFLGKASAGRGLPPFIPELAHWSMKATLVPVSQRNIEDNGLDRDGDLLRRVPVFSPVAELLTYEWPVHRIGADFLPATKPARATHLIVYRNRRDHGGWIELNRWAAEIARQVRDNAAGKTGVEILADNHLRHPLLVGHSPVHEGRVILEALRQRDIIVGVHKGTPTGHWRSSQRGTADTTPPC